MLIFKTNIKFFISMSVSLSAGFTVGDKELLLLQSKAAQFVCVFDFNSSSMVNLSNERGSDLSGFYLT